jgi:hypothetical protein
VIVSDPDELRDIMRGKNVEVRQNGELPDVGSVQPLHKRVGVEATCFVEIREVWAHVQGGYVAVVRQTTRVREHVPRLLARSTGYTSDVTKAAIDEPEAVPEDWTDPGAGLRAVQQLELERATQERLSFGEQLDGLLAEARTFGDDVFRREIRQLQAARERLERRLQRERAQRAA